jgi:hypothetical protein
LIRTRIVDGSGLACLGTVGVTLAATRSSEQDVVDLAETEVGDRLEILFDLEGREDVLHRFRVRSRVSARCSTSARST